MAIQVQKMTQQEIRTGLKAFESSAVADRAPHAKGEYLAWLIINKAAAINDVAQVAITTTFSSTVGETSLVLPTLFNLQSLPGISGEMDQFSSSVNAILGPDHPQKIPSIPTTMDELEPLSHSAEVLDEQGACERVNFLVTHYILNCSFYMNDLGGCSLDAMSFYDLGVTHTIIGNALDTKYYRSKPDRAAPEADLIYTRFELLLRTITGDHPTVHESLTNTYKIRPQVETRLNQAESWEEQRSSWFSFNWLTSWFFSSEEA